MCDTSVYLTKGNSEELLISSIELVSIEGREITIRNIFGEQKKVSGSIREINLMENKIVINV